MKYDRKRFSDLCESVAAGSDLVKMQTSYHSFPALLPTLPGETNVREGEDGEMKKTKRKTFLR